MRQILFGVSFFAMVVPVCSSSQSATNEASVQDDAGKPYEIVITPTITRADLRGLIENVEEDFFEKFNELNIDENYDIACYEYTPTMSHIKERVCEPWFMIQARGSNVSEAAYLLGTTGTAAQNRSAAIVFTPRAMRNRLNREYETLQEKMEELTESNEEFRSIGSVLAQLKYRLENFGQE